MYRSIDVRFWSDPKIKQLPPDGKLLAAYLIANPHSHVSGLYYLPRVLMSHETGDAQDSDLDTLLMQISRTGFAFFDDQQELVFVVSMFRHQAYNMNEKMLFAARDQIRRLHPSTLIDAFLETYPKVAALLSEYPLQNPPVHGWKQYLIDRVSTPSRYPPDVQRTVTVNSNSDQEQGSVNSQQRTVSVISDVASPPSPSVSHIRKPDPTQLMEIWNRYCGTCLPALRKWTAERHAAGVALFDSYHGNVQLCLDDFVKAMYIATRSSFCLGAGSNGWTLTFDWLVNDTHLARVLEGSFGATDASGAMLTADDVELVEPDDPDPEIHTLTDYEDLESAVIIDGHEDPEAKAILLTAMKDLSVRNPNSRKLLAVNQPMEEWKIEWRRAFVSKMLEPRLVPVQG